MGLSTIKPFPFEGRNVIDVAIVKGGSKMFGAKLTKDIFAAIGYIGSFKVKGHGSSFNVRLLKLKSMILEKKLVKFEAHKRFQRCHS